MQAETKSPTTQIQCDYCTDYDTKEIFNNRKLSPHNDGVYTGIALNIFSGMLNLYYVIDCPYTKALSDSACFKINFCPMCGRKLGE